jgi:hypothetical protein
MNKMLGQSRTFFAMVMDSTSTSTMRLREHYYGNQRAAIIGAQETFNTHLCHRSDLTCLRWQGYAPCHRFADRLEMSSPKTSLP